MFIEIYSLFVAIIILITLTIAIAVLLSFIVEFLEANIYTTRMIILCLYGITIFVAITLYFFDNFPFKFCVCSLISNSICGITMSKYPNVLTNYIVYFFIGVINIYNHYHILNFMSHSYKPLLDVISALFLCSWMMPILLVLTICCNDATLPTTEKTPKYISGLPSDLGGKNNSNIIKKVLSKIYQLKEV